MKLVRRRDAQPGYVSHDPWIRKRRWLGPGDAPSLIQMAAASIPAGRRTSPHVHEDMWEVFLVLAGGGQARVGRQSVPLAAGDCLVVEPGEAHWLAADARRRLKVFYLGLAPEAARRAQARPARRSSR